MLLGFNRTLYWDEISIVPPPKPDPVFYWIIRNELVGHLFMTDTKMSFSEVKRIYGNDKMHSVIEKYECEYKSGYDWMAPTKPVENYHWIIQLLNTKHFFKTVDKFIEDEIHHQYSEKEYFYIVGKMINE